MKLQEIQAAWNVIGALPVNWEHIEEAGEGTLSFAGKESHIRRRNFGRGYSWLVAVPVLEMRNGRYGYFTRWRSQLHELQVLRHLEFLAYQFPFGEMGMPPSDRWSLSFGPRWDEPTPSLVGSLACTQGPYTNKVEFSLGTGTAVELYYTILRISCAPYIAIEPRKKSEPYCRLLFDHVQDQCPGITDKVLSLLDITDR